MRTPTQIGCYPQLLMFGAAASTAIDFLPDDDSQAWVATRMGRILASLGQGTSTATPHTARLFTQNCAPADLDGLFALMCELQDNVGQADVEFALVDSAEQSSMPKGFSPLGNANGQLMHTFRHNDDYATLVSPGIFKKTELLFAAVARELGRIALARVGHRSRSLEEVEGEAELAGIALGMGVWVANGAYIFENSCCGGGCGIDLRSLRTGLSMPEACFAVALDGHRRGVSRRAIAKHLQSTQKAAFKRSWGHVSKSPQQQALLTQPVPELTGQAVERAGS